LSSDFGGIGADPGVEVIGIKPAEIA